MVRKSTRTAALKAAEKNRRESPRNRRKRSVSKSDDTDEDIPKPKTAQSEVRSEKGSSDNESDTESKKPLKKRTRSMAVNDLDNTANKSRVIKPNKEEEQQDAKEEVNEENTSKGKSNTRNKSNKDNVNDETQNENVQVTDESLNDNPPNDALSKNGMETSEIDVNISESIVAEMTCDNQSSEITTEETTEIVISEHDKTAQNDTEENSADLTQVNSEEIINKEELPEISTAQSVKETENHETCSVNKEEITTKKIKLNRLPRDNQRDKEDKKEDQEIKKKITLKRLESKSSSLEENDPSPKEHTATESEDWGSSYEKPNKDEKSLCKRITLKRTTVDEAPASDKKERKERSLSLQEGSERRKSTSNSTIIIHERQRRKSSTGSETAAVASEEKPPKIKKPTKIVKLIRKLPEEPQEPPPPGEELIKKYKWLPSSIFQDTVDVLHLETLQEICPDIQFLDEQDVDLEIVIRDTKSPEKIKRKTFKELEEEEMENIQAELDAEPEDVKVTENIIAMNRKISIVEDTASKLKPPPSPARNPVSPVLFITNLVRPFTVKQLRELLERTGTIKEDRFWTDRIKSKCYVCYDTVEQAESTRNALHGVHWPIGNGKKLIIDYATEEDMENAKNPPPPVVIKKEKSPEKENKQPDLQEKQDKEDTKTIKREWDLGKEDHNRRRRSLSRSRERRERKHSRRSYTPEDRHKKRRHEEPVPQKAMEDLFLKTKATPSIYWQPLSPEEIARKQQQRQARLEENKRRLEEIRSSGRGGRDRSGRDRNFRRR